MSSRRPCVVGRGAVPACGGATHGRARITSTPKPGTSRTWPSRTRLPQIGRVAVLYDSHLDQAQLKAGKSIAHKAGIERLRLGIDQPSDFRGAFRPAEDARMDAMLVHSSPILVDQAAVIAAHANFGSRTALHTAEVHRAACAIESTEGARAQGRAKSCVGPTHNQTCERAGK